MTSLLYILASTPGGLFYDVSAGTVALISLEKCVCVFSPFKAKQLITRKRMTVALAFVYAFEFSTYGSMFSSTYLSWESYPSTNSTPKLVLMTKGDIQTLLLMYEYLNTLFYLIFTQILVASCSMLLIFSLNLSKRFRSRESNVYKHMSPRDRREARLVKTVLYIAVSFCLSNQFLIVVTVLYRFGSDFGRSPVDSFLLSVSLLVTTLNGAINIVIYYNTNSKYRRVLKKIMCRDWSGII
ncbi:uncharacterized protein LOC131937130 [Physella acuta]|uniref:uncharacterized protein LOC131937130 n=1 Tax=Physella acuta TaxID=109671 RepID=UPI0027DCA480|nr:uncharacterized protein LOC131937130 [Physella acuta]